MADEIGEGHQPREYEGCDAGLESDQDQEAEGEFDQPGNPGERADRRHACRGRKMQDLLPAVAEQHERRDDPQEAQQVRLPQIGRRQQRLPFMFAMSWLCR
ncbi:hypothetical protein ABID08_004213 [Rhizobium binae]|uniref:Uncharacterized protein n=1 Tax=Rhizobium binae TaxID=1138190 RepID=A0ABV2MK54_9HYPH